jgi:formylglycine-generating enzyme
VTNRLFRQFVREIGHVIFAEIPPAPKVHLGALSHMLKAGSLVFMPRRQAVHRRGWSNWGS